MPSFVAASPSRSVTRSGSTVARIAVEVLLPGIDAGAVRRTTVAVLDAEVDIVRLSVHAAGVRREVHVTEPSFSDVWPKVRVGFARRGALEDDVDHARDGVGPILRGRAVTQHLDAIDHRRRDRVEVHARRASAHSAVHVHERAVVATLAVDEHEDLIGPEPAQRRRPNVVGSVGDGGPRKVERRRAASAGPGSSPCARWRRCPVT